MNKITNYLASGLMLLALGCSDKDRANPTSKPSEKQNSGHILNPYSKATKQDIGNLRNEVERKKVAKKLDTVAKIYSGYISVRGTSDNYVLELVKDEPLNQDYFEKLQWARDNADFNGDGHVSLEEAQKLENIVINTFLGK